MALTKTQVSELYVAIFNRASEGQGNNFWQGRDGSVAEIADAMLATAPAQAFFAGTDNEAFVQLIYQNTKGSVGDAEGVAFWTDRLDNGVSRGELVEQFIGSLNHSELEGEALENQKNFQNRVEVSNYVADTIELPMDDIDTVLGFNANLQGVTADPASVDAVKVKVDEVLNPVDPVIKAVDNLVAAEKAVDDYLKEAAKIEAVKKVLAESADDAEKPTNSEIEQAIDTLVRIAAGEVKDNAPQFNADANASAAANAAAIRYQQELNTVELDEANAQLKQATDAILAVPGAAVALSNLKTASEQATSTGQAAADAKTAQEGELSKFNTVNKGQADVTLDELFEVKKGKVELKAGVAETATANVGLSVVLNAYQKQVDAQEAAKAAQEQFLEAAVVARYVDFKRADKAKDIVGDKDAIAEAFSTNVADANALTQAQVAAELDKLFALAQTAAGETLEKDEEGLVEGAALEEIADYNALRSAVNDFESAAFASTPEGEVYFTGPLATGQQVADAAVQAAEEKIGDLADALEGLQAALDLQEGLGAREQAVEDAKDAFEELGVELPVTVENTKIAGADNDLFLVADKGGIIVNFGVLGEDKLYVGADKNYSLVALGEDKDITDAGFGKASDFEIFFEQDGTATKLYVEKQAFGGNAKGDADIVTITLNGVSAEDLVLEDGFLFIA